MNEDKSFKELINLIFDEERTIRKEEVSEIKEELLNRIDLLESQIKDPVLFSEKVVASKSEIIDILGPALGKMIRKFLSTEIEKINARISQTSQNISSKKFWTNTVLVKLGLKKKSKIQIDFPQIKQILIIDKSSGLILGQFGNEDIADSDIVAGMFTAIKTFAETAFTGEENQELGLIDYNEFKIKLQAYGTFYYAVIFSGRYDSEFEDFITDALDTFTEDHFIPLSGKSLNGKMFDVVNKEMELYFNSTCKKLEEKLY